jgi:signal transduction histidine kinase
MKLSLYQRLSFSLLGVFIVITVAFLSWWQHFEQETRFESEQSLHLSLAANLARDNPLLQQGVYDYDALGNLFHTLMVLGPAFEFYYVDPQGKIITHSADSSLVKRSHIDLVPLLSLTQNQASLPIYGDDPRHEDRQKIFSAAPVFNGTALQGYLYVIVTGQQYDSAFNKTSLNHRIELSLVAASTVLIFLFIVMLWLFRCMTKPVQKLSQQMNLFKQSGFDKNVLNFNDWHDRDNEVSQLASVFQNMANQMDDQLTQLSTADSQRRELLADISHDLRTPLASLQGYMETISLQGSSINTDKRQEYINVALKNASELKSLIDQIFELAHLEGGQVAINLETFNLAELLYDVIAKFGLKAQRKNIKLTIADNISAVQAYSDIGKIERILSNLIENAIRHTSEGGNIEIGVNESSTSQCQIIVSDNGSGISAEDIAYIFDARYRASNATNTKNTGLGLAITKKLLELLKSEIHVISELGKGTRFSFNIRKVVIN